MQREWHEMVAREGMAPAAACGIEVGEDEEPPCPACGTAEPLVDGACAGCGLVLE